MVKVSEFPAAHRKEFLARTDMPAFDETPFVVGKPLSERRIALISTGGMHDRADSPFHETSADYRIIAKSIDSNDLVMSHISTNFDRLGFQRDINVALPIDRMKELEDEGVIGSLADFHYSFMGSTPPEKMEPYVRDIVKLFIKDAVDTVLLCPVWPSCTRAVGGLSHYIERAGIATTQISLVREHSEKIKPPRALVVPFELGRPFGAPQEPEFQRRVLLDVLALLDRDEGPVLETFPDAPPIGGDAENGEGWACPVNFGSAIEEADVGKDPLGALSQEMERLRMWYDLGLKERNGRTTVGISGVDLSELAAFMVAFAKDENAAQPRADIPRHQMLKYAIDEVKAYYFEAASSQPGDPSDKELSDWYYDDTVIAETLRDINVVCANSSDALIEKMSDRRIFPVHQQHHKR